MQASTYVPGFEVEREWPVEAAHARDDVAAAAGGRRELEAAEEDDPPLRQQQPPLPATVPHGCSS
jgi:hypothetical protein